MNEIREAIERFEARKSALSQDDPGRKKLTSDDMRTLLVGLDLDIEELDEYRNMALRAALATFESTIDEVGMDPGTAFCHMIAGTWVDGLVVGVTLAEARKDD